MIRVVEYRAGDIAKVKLGHFDDISMGDPSPDADLIGTALSVVSGDDVMGVVSAYAEGETAWISMALSDELRAHPVFMHRSAKRGLQLLLKKPGISSVGASVHKDFAVAKEWLARLGFAPAGQSGDILEYLYVRS